MTIINVSSAAQLTSALGSAQAGDTIKLAAGNYGDVSISSLNFASDVTLTSADPTHAAVFGSLSIQSSAHVHIDDVNITYVPTAQTMSFSSAVSISNSQAITITGGVMVGGPAVNGVPQNATQAQLDADTTGNVLGVPTARGITIYNSSGVTVHGTDISQFDRGVILQDATHTTLDDNNIHDLRRTAISGTGDNLTISNNDLHDAHPWRWGDSANGGDHADFIALYTDTGATAASANIAITGNIMAQGAGAAILGMWVEGGTAGFSNVTVTGNAIEVANDQGILLGDIAGGTVSGNTLVEPAGGAQSPAIIMQSGVANVSVTGNLVSSVTDQNSGYTGNLVHANTTVQSTDPTATGYYNATLLNQLTGLNPAQIFTTVAGGVTFVAAPAAAGPSVTAQSLLNAGGTAGHASIGGSGDDNLVGTSGNDTLVGNGGADTLTGGAGNDLYVEPNGSATIVEAANGGTDTLITKGDHTLEANVENLVIDPTTNNNWAATGNALNNVIIGNAGGNVLTGLDGNDTIEGGYGGADQIFGGNGNDVLLGDGGHDTLSGGAGADNFVFATGYGTDVVTDFNQTEGDTVTIVGTTYSVAQVGSNTVITLASGETMTLNGVTASSLHAGTISEANTFAGTAPSSPPPVSPPPVSPPPVSPPPVSPPPVSPPPVSPPPVSPPPVSPPPVSISPPPPAAPGSATGAQTSTVGQNLTSVTGHTQVIGGSGDDTVTGGSDADYLRGGQGNDVINGGSAFNDMNGNQGNDTIHGGSGDNWVVGGQGSDMLFGGGGTNLILGNLGNDTLHAGSGNDVLRGGQGDDVIFGGPGNDFISGDLGNNTETGGAGADTFHSFAQVGLDLVTNFNEAKGDHVMLDPGTQYTVSQVGADTVINMVGGGEMILQHVTLSSLHSGWITVG